MARHQLPAAGLLLEHVGAQNCPRVVLSLDHRIVGGAVGRNGDVAVDPHFQVAEILTFRLVCW